MNKKAWRVIICAVFGAIAIAITQNKAVPCIEALQIDMNISMTTAGWLSSIFNIIAIIIAFPAAAMVSRLGIKKACVFSILSSLIGSVLGICSSSVWMLMLSRVIEGAGAGIIAVAVPSLIPIWFPPEKRGAPTGLFTSWQYCAQAVCFFLGTQASNTFGWRGVWFGNAAILLIALIISFFAISEPSRAENFAATEKHNGIALRECLKNRPALLISSAMLCFTFASFALVTWAASYWNVRLELSMVTANTYIGIFALISIPVVIASGWLLDRVNKKRFGLISFSAFAIVAAAAFFLCESWQAAVFAIIYPFTEGAIATALWALIPLAERRPGECPSLIAMFTAFSNVGMLLGPPVAGAAAEALGWHWVGILIAAISILGILAVMRCNIRKAH